MTDQLQPISRSVRVLRLVAALSILLALGAVAATLGGAPEARSQRLVAAAVFLGVVALLGVALVAWPFLKKDKNDPRP